MLFRTSVQNVGNCLFEIFLDWSMVSYSKNVNVWGCTSELGVSADVSRYTLHVTAWMFGDIHYSVVNSLLG